MPHAFSRTPNKTTPAPRPAVPVLGRLHELQLLATHNIHTAARSSRRVHAQQQLVHARDLAHAQRRALHRVAHAAARDGVRAGPEHRHLQRHLHVGPWRQPGHIGARPAAPHVLRARLQARCERERRRCRPARLRPRHRRPAQRLQRSASACRCTCTLPLRRASPAAVRAGGAVRRRRGCCSCRSRLRGGSNLPRVRCGR
mmetsp:Transcript_26632/g.67864  ORF Transcript_26632/g.67864 Transcript_26632/m.67864 type:complete len:200 (-) Transcript_26632:1501-2100(-)